MKTYRYFISYHILKRYITSAMSSITESFGNDIVQLSLEIKTKTQIHCLEKDLEKKYQNPDLCDVTILWFNLIGVED